MAVRLAFPTSVLAELTIPEIAPQARAWGYEGLDLRLSAPAGRRDEDPHAVREALAASGIAAACLSDPTPLDEGLTQREGVARARRGLDLAARIGCGAACFRVGDARAGQGVDAAVTRIAELVRPIAEHAGGLGVRVLLENAGALAQARSCWRLVNLLRHAPVAICWNAATAAAAGERPSRSVPLLHGRIGLARLGGAGPADRERLGPAVVQSLRGIGFDGFVVLEPQGAAAAQTLAALREQAAAWVTPVARAAPTKTRPAPAAAR